MNNFIQNKIMPPMMKFLNTRAVTAIKNGMIYHYWFSFLDSWSIAFPSRPRLHEQNQIGPTLFTN